jgi:protein disulfide-isomerase
MIWNFVLLWVSLNPWGHEAITTNQWVTDYEEAFELAVKKEKYVLINFTGSDWCGWCHKLTDEVFSQPEFQKFAEDELILLKIDFPRRTKQSKEEKIQNQRLANRFAVQGFPTILLADPNEKVVLRTGYRRGGANQYISHLKRYIK